MLLLTTGVTLYPTLIKTDWYGNPVRMCAAAFALSYFITLVGALIRNKHARNTLYTVLLLFALVHCLLEISCLSVLNNPYNDDIAAAILATNASEATEFIDSFCNARVIVFLCFLPLFLAAILWIGGKLRFMSRRIVRHAGVLIFLLCMAITTQYGQSFYCHTSVDLVACLTTIHETLGTKIHHTHPSVKITSTAQPPLVIWIIGESLTSHHCSLYGYAKPTNPLLQKKVNEGEALLFTGVKAAELHTQQAFQLMMGTYAKGTADSTRWYDVPALPDIAKAAGYRTHWISNQSKKGLWDNIVSQYADLCDTTIFIGNKYSGANRATVDGELLPVVKRMLARPLAKDFYVIHLVGCHMSFAMRYPSTFAYFKESDYTDYPAKQRKKRATYDNAVRYNDYVVSTLMDMVRHREAVVVYAPDHGLDIFESHPDIAAHSNADNPVSSKAGHDIPLLIYTTETYRRRHPDTMQRMKKSVGRTFDMEDAPYLMMDLMQCDFVSAPAVPQKSLIRKLEER